MKKKRITSYLILVVAVLAVAWLVFNRDDRILLSRLQPVPEAEPLPGDHDETGFDLAALDMYDSNNKKIIIIDACLSAYFSDMAEAYGVFSLQGQSSKDQIYIGWERTVDTHSNRLIEFFSGDTTDGFEMFWGLLGLGDSVKAAFEYIDRHGSTQAQKSFFYDTVWDWGGDDNILIYGLGVVNLKDITLGI